MTPIQWLADHIRRYYPGAIRKVRTRKPFAMTSPIATSLPLPGTERAK